MTRVFSGIQPSGDLHIGNYLGAIRNWVKDQDIKQNIFCVVDMHAITVPQDPADLKIRVFDLYAWYLACGLDPQKNILFVQSHNLHHAQCYWIFNCFMGVGQLERMTQYKDKKQKFKDGFIPAGLLNYPVLMAADILLYEADEVPVGNDQKQHVELARDVAERMNVRFPGLLREPQFTTDKMTTRIMSLVTPENKMSKSDENQNGCIYLKDSADIITKKIKSATTDSERTIEYKEERAGLRNLIDIYCGFSGLTSKEIVAKYEGKGYKEFKTELAEVVVQGLNPMQEKFKELRKDEGHLLSMMKKGAEDAMKISGPVLDRVQRAVGFVI